ncbi:MULTISPECIES: HEAT repeat domain-containing protein [unclassified Microcystis]|uniref:HEAT repeat domain-containing protein n=1 Tax=unclassified Microcystis TaxID=2643300 RepID=UPI00258FFD16|nr:MULTISPECIES: HEAT repeat domain-containing protein [unclassified Microcystis]MCA2517786.1 HEAT repeat domain-containing protein [Microcystis sp. M59BS1]MCA2559239.1 HEAT repeat domain-containing protein [Microcystis sp. M43BS1]
MGIFDLLKKTSVSDLKASRDIPCLVEVALKNSNPVIRYEATVALRDISDSTAIYALSLGLKAMDKTIQCRAVDALGKFQDPRVVELLSQVINGQYDTELQCRVVDAIGKLQEPKLIDLLHNLLSSQQESILHHVIQVLGESRDTCAVDPLIAFLKQKSLYVHTSAVEALGKIGDTRAVESLIAFLDVLTFPPENYASLDSFGYSTLHKKIAQAIESIRTACGTDTFVTSLKPSLVTALIHSLAEQPKTSDDVNNTVRRMAVRTLSIMPENILNRGAALIVEKMDYSAKFTSSTQQSEKETNDPLFDLTEIIQRRNIRKLIALVKADKRLEFLYGCKVYPALNQGAAILLRGIAITDPDLLRSAKFLFSTTEKTLAKMLDHQDRIVRQSVAVILDKLGWQPTTETEKIHYLVAKERWSELVAVGKPAIKSLIGCLKDEQVDIRVQATWTLGEIGDITATDSLLSSLPLAVPEEWEGVNPSGFDHSREQYYFEDYKAQVAVLAKALVKIYRSKPEKLIRLLQRFTDVWTGISIVWGLCEMGNKKATEAIVNWLFAVGQNIPEPSVLAWTYANFNELRAFTYFFREIVPSHLLSKLLGDYTDLLLDILTWKPPSIYQELKNEVNTLDEIAFLYAASCGRAECEWDLSISNEALQKLCRLNTPFANNILYKFLHGSRKIVLYSDKFKNIPSWSTPETTTYVTTYLDLGNLQEMVKYEILKKNRPNPRYIPSAYLDDIYFENKKTSSSPSEKQNTA